MEYFRLQNNIFSESKRRLGWYKDRVPSFYYLQKTSFSQLMQNIATFHYSETACPHFSKSLLQSDKIDKLSFHLYYQNTNRYLTKQDDAIRMEI